ncbi:MAG TPA: TonB family protein [Chitinophagales bacterium]|nr:TonB family protein [Chitinophagales bacterium]
MDQDKLLKADWDDMVFEGRNKEYGAYFLRKKYNKHVNTATAITIAAVLIGFSIPYLSQFFKSDADAAAPVTVVDVTKLAAPPPLDKTTPPPPPPDLPPPPPKTVKFTPPVVKPDEEVPEEAEPPKIEDLQQADPGTETITPDVDIDFSNVPANPVIDEPAPTKPLMFVEKMPAFPGGDQALQAYLQKNIRYPAAARENGIEGTVVLQFVVNTDGSISEIKPLREVGGGATEEAIRVVRSMPKWTPGNNNGVNVPVYFNLPVTFQLSAGN